MALLILCGALQSPKMVWFDTSEHLPECRVLVHRWISVRFLFHINIDEGDVAKLRHVFTGCFVLLQFSSLTLGALAYLHGIKFWVSAVLNVIEEKREASVLTISGHHTAAFFRKTDAARQNWFLSRMPKSDVCNLKSSNNYSKSNNHVFRVRKSRFPSYISKLFGSS